MDESTWRKKLNKIKQLTKRYILFNNRNFFIAYDLLLLYNALTEQSADSFVVN